VEEVVEIQIERTRMQRFWHLVAEQDLYEMVEKSGFGEYEFYLFQKRRMRNALISTLAAAIPALLISPWLSLLGVIFFVYSWRNAYTKEKHEYNGLVYEKQISWYVFQRLIVTYLQDSNDSVIKTFRKLLNRLEEGEFKNNLYRLIIDITENPQSVQPYMHFAEVAAGGTDEARTFMTSLYNYTNHTSDSSIIDELSDIARKAMMRGIEDIRKHKERTFYMYPTKITMVNFIPMVGYMAGAAFDIFSRNMNNL